MLRRQTEIVVVQQRLWRGQSDLAAAVRAVAVLAVEMGAERNRPCAAIATVELSTRSTTLAGSESCVGRLEPDQVRRAGIPIGNAVEGGGKRQIKSRTVLAGSICKYSSSSVKPHIAQLKPRVQVEKPE
ncbi:MAG: hypothetical protein GPOALKHO_001349 [Sodalis sp.]|nr:MAG: hypothetical protein GPOALKHO_001349 [Sodalis sp.]